MRHLATTLVGIAAIACAAVASAQSDYPNRVIRIVVPFGPGGSTDLASRVIGQKLAEQMGQPVTVDNSPGANSNVGADLVAKSSPDGYTVLWNSSSIIFNRHIHKANLNHDLFRDFLPVALVATVPQIFVVIPLMPARNLQEVIAYIRAGCGPSRSPAWSAPKHCRIRPLSTNQERQIRSHQLARHADAAFHNP